MSIEKHRSPFSVDTRQLKTQTYLNHIRPEERKKEIPVPTASVEN